MSHARLNAERARGIVLALGLLALAGPAKGQGTIVYSQPPQPIYYAPVGSQSTDIDLNGDGSADYTLISESGQTVLQPRNNNSFIVVPEPPPDLGAFVAALHQGDSIDPTPSSLDPRYVWFDASTDPFGYSLIAAMNTSGPLGNFFNGIHYIGLEFAYGGGMHYGWMRIDSPSPDVAYGQLLDWAYETSPNTPILAGAVPEPGTMTLCLLGLAIFSLSSYKARLKP